MKNILILIFASLLTGFCLGDNEDMVKRKIVIFPFINKNKVIEYNYLSDIIMETVRSALFQKDLYEFSNYSVSDDKFDDYKKDDLLNLKTVIKISRNLNSDIALSGQYIIFEKKILIIIHAVDIFTGDIAAVTKEEGGTGIDLFNVINKSITDILDKIILKLPMMNRTEYNNNMKKMSGTILTPLKKTGIGLISAGSALMLIGLPVLIYDVAGYSSVLIDNRQKYLESYKNYEAYDKSYYTFTGLLISSICISGAGLLLSLISIPLFLVKIPNDNKQLISFSINFKDNYNNPDSRNLCFMINIRL